MLSTLSCLQQAVAGGARLTSLSRWLAHRNAHHTDDSLPVPSMKPMGRLIHWWLRQFLLLLFGIPLIGALTRCGWPLLPRLVEALLSPWLALAVTIVVTLSPAVWKGVRDTPQSHFRWLVWTSVLAAVRWGYAWVAPAVVQVLAASEETIIHTSLLRPITSLFGELLAPLVTPLTRIDWWWLFDQIAADAIREQTRPQLSGQQQQPLLDGYSEDMEGTSLSPSATVTAAAAGLHRLWPAVTTGSRDLLAGAYGLIPDDQVGGPTCGRSVCAPICRFFLKPVIPRWIKLAARVGDKTVAL